MDPFLFASPAGTGLMAPHLLAALALVVSAHPLPRRLSCSEPVDKTCRVFVALDLWRRATGPCDGGRCRRLRQPEIRFSPRTVPI